LNALLRLIVCELLRVARRIKKIVGWALGGSSESSRFRDVAIIVSVGEDCLTERVVCHRTKRCLEVLIIIHGELLYVLAIWIGVEIVDSE
jgi:hypothetical protein